MEYELYHHGVKGMKWGVRRIRQRMTENRKLRAKKKVAAIKEKAHKNHWSEDAKRSSLMRTKNVKQLSNADLKKLNERIRLEKEYSNLTKKQKSAGQKAVEQMLLNAGKKVAKDLYENYAKDEVESYVKTTVMPKVAAGLLSFKLRTAKIN